MICPTCKLPQQEQQTDYHYVCTCHMASTPHQPVKPLGAGATCSRAAYPPVTSIPPSSGDAFLAGLRASVDWA